MYSYRFRQDLGRTVEIRQAGGDGGGGKMFWKGCGELQTTNGTGVDVGKNQAIGRPGTTPHIDREIFPEAHVAVRRSLYLVGD